MRTVGLLLVSALMVVPVATVQQVTRTFRATLFAAMVVGTVASPAACFASTVTRRAATAAFPGSVAAAKRALSALLCATAGAATARTAMARSASSRPWTACPPTSS